MEDHPNENGQSEAIPKSLQLHFSPPLPTKMKIKSSILFTGTIQRERSAEQLVDQYLTWRPSLTMPSSVHLKTVPINVLLNQHQRISQK